ncbi:hypothetical protein BTA51_14130 [Hahella sp. CCB-MM4]|uniref:hypothetical protein n=1 Tax=Hahella sp. (strain CCB-MM4) TaxID=1926491 RepID=UPI000B9B57E0|nr:hypothetical protein [Hahella sp. CCB-MM4]OZG72663.1 hypothetical protein BTA51_14130 [Hahella sp. CCB-MM4]
MINLGIFLSVVIFCFAGLLKFHQAEQILIPLSSPTGSSTEIKAPPSQDEHSTEDAESDIRQDSPATIRLEGNTLFYYGEISEVSWANFQSFVADIDTTKVSRLLINSGGGDTRYGRLLGRWVKENIDIIEVQGGCFSSCANYIFPAAREKRIQEGAFVGWHGSEAQFEVLALSQPNQTGEDIFGAEIKDALISAFPELDGTPELKAEISRQFEQSMQSLQDERQFFNELGLDGKFTVYGLMPEYLAAYEASDKRGWSFTLADMEKLGLGKVKYLSDQRYEDSDSFKKYLYLITLHP